MNIALPPPSPYPFGVERSSTCLRFQVDYQALRSLRGPLKWVDEGGGNGASDLLGGKGVKVYNLPFGMVFEIKGKRKLPARGELFKSEKSLPQQDPKLLNCGHQQQ